jgi:2-polyprenyl-6-methoxyphenol hydroxylase-like FAD-dependent oxidoreductase
MGSYDLVIVGGGIGGAGLATVMARAGKRVLVLERSEAFEDRVRGEWIAPWGVVEVQSLGLYELLRGAGAHHLTRHVTYDESLDPTLAEAATLPLGMFKEGVPGPLCIGHPKHCQTLFDAAAASGAEVRRGVNVTKVEAGAAPTVSFEHDGVEQVARARLLVGADGRTSQVREAAGIELHQDAPHHWFAGLLLEGADDWADDLEAIGTEDDFAFLAFPQGQGRVRVYGGYALGETGRFKGPDGSRRFLDTFRMRCAPNNQALAAGRPAGPLLSYFNNDSWTDAPFAPGVVLVGDAAGWNDPIVGLGLSITYRDVRIVSDLLLGSDDWAAPSFAPYADERRERMRRLRFTAALQASLDMEFGAAAKARRASLHERAATDPTLRMHALAVMAGPEAVPAEMFTEAHRARVLGLETAE